MKLHVPLVMLRPEGAPLIPCTQCAKCCTYVAVGVNPPTSPRLASDILWYLYHHGVSVHRDKGGEWSVVFETHCRHLGPDLLCGIYEQRPHICRGFDNTTCEVNSPTGGQTFTNPEEFVAYLKARKPAIYRRVAARFLPEPLRSEAAAKGRPRRAGL